MKKAKKILSNILKWSINKAELFENRLSVKNSDDILFDDLAPIDDVNQNKVYSPALTWAFKNPKVRNIAITGPYGSGKSSIIKTFEKENPHINFVNVSLASFREDGTKNEKTSNIEIELSILQQLLYKVGGNTLSDSRFARIKKSGKLRNLLLSIYALIVFVAVTVLFYPALLNRFNWWELVKETYKTSILYGAILIIIPGIIFILNYFITLIMSSKLNKLKFSVGEIELKGNEKSILNQYLDEILYFFEVTHYDGVIIEDLDRFDNTDIFTKLREINLLINNSDQVKRKITFIYALKDEMFKDKSRTKFFDFILPVIPVVNSSNSFEILRKKFSLQALNVQISDNFLTDITLYIDDMRVLKNVFNEFVIYKRNLSEVNLKPEKLLAMVLYKNIYPTDFADLNINKGFVYEMFQSKYNWILSETQIKQKTLAEYEERLSKINGEILLSIDELRSVYIAKTLETTGGNGIVIDGRVKSIAELKDDIYFNKFINLTNIQISNNQYISNSNTSFNQIQNLVNPNRTYSERQSIVINVEKDEKRILESSIHKLNSEISEIKHISLKQLLASNTTQLEAITEKEKDKNLLIYLLRGGYIDEMYHSVISYFYEGSLSKGDMEFVLSVKDWEPLDFEFPLDKTPQLIKRLTVDEFKRTAILNYDLINFILGNEMDYNVFFPNLFGQFSQENKISLDFVRGYVKNGKEVSAFIRNLCKNWKDFWTAFVDNNGITESEKEEFLKHFVLFADFESIFLEKDRVRDFISQKENFLSLIDNHFYTSKIEQVLSELDVKFKRITSFDSSEQLIRYVYENKLYAINGSNIFRFINLYGNTNLSKPELISYSDIIKYGDTHLINYIHENIDQYVTSVLLLSLAEIDEKEDSLISLLSDINLDDSLKLEIIRIGNFEFSDISLIPTFLWDEVFVTNKVRATWTNVIEYYQENEEINESLTKFLNAYENYNSLSIIPIANVQGSLSLPVSEFIEDLILSTITNESFRELIKVINYSYEELAFENLSDFKIGLLIDYDILELTEQNYNLLKEHFDTENIHLIEKGIGDNVDEISEFLFEVRDYELLLKSNKITSKIKIYLIGKLTENMFSEENDLADIVLNLLLVEYNVKVELKILQSILKFSTDSIKKAKFAIGYMPTASIEDLEYILTLIGEPYSQLLAEGKRPSLSMNSLNLGMAKILHQKSVIKNFIEKGDRIKIINRTT